MGKNIALIKNHFYLVLRLLHTLWNTDFVIIIYSSVEKKYMSVYSEDSHSILDRAPAGGNGPRNYGR